MRISRRNFLSWTTTALAGGVSVPSAIAEEVKPDRDASDKPLIISTWPFGKPANEKALEVLLTGGSILDAVEQGIRVTELGSNNSSVGLGGIPNAAGVVQLDACIMLGPGHKAGSVAALEGIRHPISAARRVMEKTSHVMLVGEGARMFALEQGLESVPVNSAEQYEVWRRSRPAQTPNPTTGGQAKPRPRAPNHDTIALLVLDAKGDLAGGCSTSGWGHKLPGRVGDSPIIGSGLYVENEIGAAGATGYGEDIMRYCGSFLVVEYMRQGLHPADACVEAIRRIARQETKGSELNVNFVALDKKGRYGAAGSGRGFQYAITNQASSRVLPSADISDVGPRK